MQPFTKHTGIAIPLDRTNVDTDQIIPKQFLKRIERTGYGEFLFYNWRFEGDGSPRKDFLLNCDPYSSGTILLARRNFGCGSSREHAVWALQDFGIRAVIAPSFADIFASNASKNGLLTVELDEDSVERMFAAASRSNRYEVTVDLERLEVFDSAGLSLRFEMDPFKRKCLLQGLDEIALTMRHLDAIEAYESRQTLTS